MRELQFMVGLLRSRFPAASCPRTEPLRCRPPQGPYDCDGPCLLSGRGRWEGHLRALCQQSRAEVSLTGRGGAGRGGRGVPAGGERSCSLPAARARALCCASLTQQPLPAQVVRPPQPKSPVMCSQPPCAPQRPEFRAASLGLQC